MKVCLTVHDRQQLKSEEESYIVRIIDKWNTCDRQNFEGQNSFLVGEAYVTIYSDLV